MAKKRVRANGEGTVFYRKDKKRWVAELSLIRPTGEYRRITYYGKTEQEAVTKLQAEQSKVFTGDFVEPTQMTLGQFLTTWLEDVARPNIRPSTYVQYKRLVEQRIIPYLGRTKLSGITTLQVLSLYSCLDREGASPRMRQLVHAVLHKAFNDAKDLNLLNRNPISKKNKPKVPKKPMTVLDREQVATFLLTAQGDRLYALYLLAITTGMRQGELLALHWSDIDLEKATISVQYSLSELGGELVRGEPKTAQGRRSVVIPQTAVRALQAHRASLRAAGINGPWIFCGSEGGPLYKSNLLQRSFKPLLERAGLPKIRFHDLRHTCASLLMAEGVPAKVVSERLGHSNITITLETYSHCLQTIQDAAVDKLDQLMGSLGIA